MTNTDGLDAFRDGPAPAESDPKAAPALFYGSVDEFVREHLRYMYIRKVGSHNAHYRWSAEWWKSAEAISRLESLWRAWEYLRLDPSTGMSVWWRDHADHHMSVLMDREGPFAKSEDTNAEDGSLPYTRPAEGMFPDMRG
jgi:hypothetical protein